MSAIARPPAPTRHPVPHRARRRLVRLLVAIGAVLSTLLVALPSTAAAGSIWISPNTLDQLPTSGSAWNALVDDARGSWGSADVSDQDSDHDTYTYAGALVAARTGDAGLRDKVRGALADAVGTESGGRTLALGRNLLGYVLAADLIGYRDARFVDWVDRVRTRELDGRTLVSTHEDRPNNWGTHAGASRIAAALYLGDQADLKRSADVFAGWLGDRGRYAGFDYGDLDWQCNRSRPVGINPAGCTIDGRDVGGVLPDDQRRAGGFQWPPSKENYVYEALQGAVVQAELLHRAGYPAWQWSNRALVRAMTWLYEVADFPAEGDDTWIPHLVNRATGSSFAAPSPSQPGKHIGYTGWTHAAGSPRPGGGGGGTVEPRPSRPPIDVRISRSRFEEDEARHAVLARRDMFVDALSGSALTADGPMLFTRPDRLGSAPRAELVRVLPKGATVYLLGGTKALAAQVARDVESLGLDMVRLSGKDRVGTALAVGNEVRRRYGQPDQVLIARDSGPAVDPGGPAAWADAVSAGAFAARTHTPIVVTPSSALDARVRQWVTARGVTATLLGGKDALSRRVARALPDRQRIAGPDRAATAAAIARTLWSGTHDTVVVTNGWNRGAWRAGYVAAGLGADLRAPILLVQPGAATQPSSTRQFLACQDGDVRIRAVGVSVSGLEGGSCS